MNMLLSIPEETLNKSKKVITINQIDKDIPVDMHLYDIFETYSSIIKCGLRDLYGKLTWNEVHYMLASINGTCFTNTDITYTAKCFIDELIAFEVYDELQSGQFGIEAKELSAKLQKEHPISVFALLSILHQCWISKKIFDDAQQYIEQYLQLKA
jgi:hypothetical protein